MNIFTSFVQKEFFHIFRDSRTMLILIAMPIVLIILFGYAITTDIKSIPIGVIDLEKNENSRKLTEQLSCSQYFTLYKIFNSQEEADIALRDSKVNMVVLFRGNTTQEIELIVDATDPNQATQLTQYAQATLLANGNNYMGPDESIGIQNSIIITPITHLLYNPQMRGAYTFVPGVMGLILILICAMMTSIGIVKEKESGSMEVLLASPIKPIYIIIAKAIPYFFISMVNIITILLLATFMLDVPINGSVALVMLLSALYAFVSLCLGLLVSTVVDTQQAAMIICGVVLMLPVVLLSGMIFPIENMPKALQVIANIVPAKWYILALKDIMIKGLTFIDVWREFAILIVMALVLIGVSIKRFKIRLA